MTQDHGASPSGDRAFVPSASSPQAVSPVPASIPSADKRYFVWSPEGLTEPRILFSTHKQAKRAAHIMAERCGEQPFFVCRTASRPIVKQQERGNA